MLDNVSTLVFVLLTIGAGVVLFYAYVLGETVIRWVQRRIRRYATRRYIKASDAAAAAEDRRLGPPPSPAQNRRAGYASLSSVPVARSTRRLQNLQQRTGHYETLDRQAGYGETVTLNIPPKGAA